MTCIVGFIKDKTVWMGGDSAAPQGWNLTVRADEKVFINGPFIMGFTSSFRMGQLLRYSFKPPRHAKGVGAYKFMVTTFVNAVRKCLQDGGYAKKVEEQECGGTFMVGYRARLFTVYDDYQVAESSRDFHAIGCGNMIALGAMAEHTGGYPDDKVLAALETAEAFSAGVRGPFNILSLPKRGKK